MGMKKYKNYILRFASSVAFSTALVVFGSTCRTLLYQPKTPAKLMNKDV